MNPQTTLNDIVSLAKRRGFVFPGSEIYGGLANTFDYGPLGGRVKKKVKDLWWETFVTRRDDMVGIDSAVISKEDIWNASGHVAGLNDIMLDCKNCKNRARVDHLIENYYEKKGQEIKVEGKSLAELESIIKSEKIKCPVCGSTELTEPRLFNQLFPVHIGAIAGDKDLAYLRGETAQGIFVNFKNILDSSRV